MLLFHIAAPIITILQTVFIFTELARFEQIFKMIKSSWQPTTTIITPKLFLIRTSLTQLEAISLVTQGCTSQAWLLQSIWPGLNHMKQSCEQIPSKCHTQLRKPSLTFQPKAHAQRTSKAELLSTVSAWLCADCWAVWACCCTADSPAEPSCWTAPQSAPERPVQTDLALN